MAAVAPPNLIGLPQKSNHNGMPDYTNAQFSQPPILIHSPKSSVRALSSRQDSTVQENSSERRLVDLCPDLQTSRTLAKSTSETGNIAQETIQCGESNEEQSTIARPRGQLQRANTDPRPQRPSPTTARDIPEENWELRHGWEDQYNSSEYLGLLSSVSRRYFRIFLRGVLGISADQKESRLSTCITPTNVTKPAANRKMRIIATPLKNGGCETV